RPFGASSPTGRSIKSLVRRAPTAVNERGGSGSVEEQLLFLKEARKNGDQGIRQNIYRCSLEGRSL
ncbi:hypothetical protein ALC62_07861, partial [Cyphomyrmex costatus]